MRLAVQIAAPPEKPLVIYDGDCNFCTVWIHRWHQSTEDRVEYLALQDERVNNRYPELPRERFETAVHLVETDGAVYSGAEAAFRALSHSSHGSLLLEWYLSWPGFARLAETGYAFVARHRRFFSLLTRLGWGSRVEASTYQIVREVFLRSLGVIYLIAFLSLGAQLMGLIGSHGILPANVTMFGFRQEVNAAHIGWQRYQLLPTLCWFSASDGVLKAQCIAGSVLAVVVILGVAPAPCLFLLWLIYLSLAGVSREFLSYQWDYLLLETGFLAIFFAPLQWRPRRVSSAPSSRVILWLLRWLLFRLMLGSGLVKLLSGDPTWRNLTALRYHYETQPLPTWIGWYAHLLPMRAQQVSTLLLFAIELGLPFLILAPRRLREIACAGFVLLQALILLTGNYCFFNLLTIVLCLLLLDDARLRSIASALLPAAWRRRFSAGPGDSDPSVPLGPAAVRARHRQWPIQVIFPLTCIAVVIPVMQFCSLVRWRVPWPGPMLTAYRWLSPLRSFNNYGLFAVMTTNRIEIVVQGSNDGVHWLDYEFKYKPGDPKRRPGFVAPHQPRLDWQMWFAALSDFRHNLWFVEFCVRLLNGAPEVSDLLASNPFPRAPPRYIRAITYEYHFTDWRTRQRTGAWWRRERKSDYLPVLSQRVEKK